MVSEYFELISANQRVSIENAHSSELSISLINDSGFRFDIDLKPKQIAGFSSGDSDIKIVLRDGDPANLLIIRPETAS